MAGLYVVNDANDSLYTVNRTTGVPTLVGVLGSGGWFSLTWDGTNLYTINYDNDTLYTINKDTGAATSVGSLGSGNWGCLTWDGTNLYTINSENYSLYTVNRTTGAATLVGTAGSLAVSGWSSLTWDGTNLYAIGTGSLYTVNRTTGVSALVGSLGSGNFSYTGLTWDGTNLYVINDTNNSLYTVNKSTGAATLSGSSGSLGTGNWESLTYIDPGSASSSKIITLNSYTADVDDTNKVPDTDFTQVQASQDNRLRLLIPAKDQLTGSPASYVDNYLYIAIPQNRELANVYYDDDLTAPQRNNFSLFQNPSSANGNLKIYKSNTELADSFVNRLIVLELL